MTDQRDPIRAASVIPAWLAIAAGELGVREVPGAGSSLRVLEYHATTTLHATDDDISWCSSFANWALLQAGVVGTNSAAAISWEKWGQPLIAPRRGCVVVLKRDDPANPNARHVGLFCRQVDAKTVHILSGNSNNMVRGADYPLARVIAYRWPAGVP